MESLHQIKMKTISTEKVWISSSLSIGFLFFAIFLFRLEELYGHQYSIEYILSSILENRNNFIQKLFYTGGIILLYTAGIIGILTSFLRFFKISLFLKITLIIAAILITFFSINALSPQHFHYDCGAGFFKCGNRLSFIESFLGRGFLGEIIVMIRILLFSLVGILLYFIWKK